VPFDWHGNVLAFSRLLTTTAAELTPVTFATQVAKDKEGVLSAVPPQTEMLALRTWQTDETGAGAGATGGVRGGEERDRVGVGADAGATAGAEGQLTTVGGVCTAAQTHNACQQKPDHVSQLDFLGYAACAHNCEHRVACGMHFLLTAVYVCDVQASKLRHEA